MLALLGQGLYGPGFTGRPNMPLWAWPITWPRHGPNMPAPSGRGQLLQGGPPSSHPFCATSEGIKSATPLWDPTPSAGGNPLFSRRAPVPAPAWLKTGPSTARSKEKGQPRVGPFLPSHSRVIGPPLLLLPSVQLPLRTGGRCCGHRERAHFQWPLLNTGTVRSWRPDLK